ncbi:DBH-like monooxygenase protein 2 homolog, partial [Leucoraja erinacea]|uniref:DBH-like monooxygenase protein 2 homolog n=1 Tax=Leucoraja erinaceus TaxID=7782 RepID=UPI002456DC19
MAVGGAWRLWLWAGAWLGVWAIEMPHHITLETGFDVFWGFDTGEGQITFAVEAQTMGWVGLGLTHSGDMTGADMAVGWVKDGQPYFQDRHGVGNEQPLIDESQDFTLESLTQNGTHTRLQYSRPFRTCDPNDLDIT